MMQFLEDKKGIGAAPLSVAEKNELHALRHQHEELKSKLNTKQKKQKQQKKNNGSDDDSSEQESSDSEVRFQLK